MNMNFRFSIFNWQLEILNELRPFARFEIKLNTEVDNDYEFSIFDLQLAIGNPQ